MSNKPHRINRFFSELKRRKVPRFITIYAVVGLGIIEAIDVIGGRFLFPDWTVRLVIGIVIGGFPVAVILSWIYDFTVKGVQKTSPLTDKEASEIPSLSWKPSWISLILLILLIALSVTYCAVPRPNAFGIKKNDWILISDLENNTGEEIYNKSLLHALTVTIDQSKYITVYPRDRIGEVLKRMRMDSINRVNSQIALEIAEREGIKAVLVPTLSKLGETFLLSIEMINPATGETVRSRQIIVDSQSEILNALQKLASKARKDMGESLNSIHITSIPLPRATTSSLEALKCLVKGHEAWYNEGRLDVAKNLLLEAIRLDPEFAYAHSILGSLYYWLNNRTKGEEHFAIALSLADRLTEKERLWIEARMENFRGNYDNAIVKYATLLKKYPNYSGTWFYLGYCYMRLGRCEEAIDAFNKSQQDLNDKDPNTYINIATCYSSLDNAELAIKNYKIAFGINPTKITDFNINREYGFTYAKLGEFEKAMETFNAMIGEGGEKEARGCRSAALLSMYMGKYSEAIEYLDESILIHKTMGNRLSELRDHIFLASVYKGLEEKEECLKEMGYARELLDTEGIEPWWFLLVGKLYIRDGNVQLANELLTEISGRIMEGNRSDNLAYNILKGEIDVVNGNYSEAEELFAKAENLRYDAFTIESLANYYILRGNTDLAISKYTEIINEFSFGWEGQEYCVRAYYNLGRLYEQEGNTEQAILNYKHFMDLWENADLDIPILIDCKERYSSLNTGL